MHKFITLPNGDAIRSDAIYAVRTADAAPPIFPGHEPMVPRVIVDFSPLCAAPEECRRYYDRGMSASNHTVCFCETNEERDALAASIREQLA